MAHVVAIFKNDGKGIVYYCIYTTFTVIRPVSSGALAFHHIDLLILPHLLLLTICQPLCIPSSTENHLLYDIILVVDLFFWQWLSSGMLQGGCADTTILDTAVFLGFYELNTPKSVHSFFHAYYCNQPQLVLFYCSTHTHNQTTTTAVSPLCGK